ncbi:hypothetical protein LTR17_019861 [Elasticomyces elasticus]|uniref:Dienelactone hydrolase domain-containing protein n=1 Tax=Elasticomyces elasticus TaxID=574655 RepID=A0AAN8A2J3_9PEZI|nr:hypothetical protein LTR97_006345 [Elasticomyces elasticus]KAK5709348.1 hypothetical protein LTR17_019861 [Elasticomyces elasticus]
MSSRYGDQPQEPEWLAKPSGACCLKGHLHNGDPKGSFERLADIETYVTKPSPEKDNGHIVFYFPDVFGFFVNGLLVMDTFAEAGYTTIGLDYFSGDPIYMHRDGPKVPQEGFDFEKWLAKYQKYAKEHVDGWIAAVKQKYGKAGTKYACTGYCFGAPYVMHALSKASGPACDVGGFAHPAFLKEHHFQNIEKPLFLSCAETDFTFETDTRNKALAILQEAKKTYSVQLFSGVEHGFALRCDLSKPYERWCKEESARGIAAYFDLHLGVYDKQSQKDGDSKL